MLGNHQSHVAPEHLSWCLFFRQLLTAPSPTLSTVQVWMTKYKVTRIYGSPDLWSMCTHWSKETVWNFHRNTDEVPIAHGPLNPSPCSSNRTWTMEKKHAGPWQMMAMRLLTHSGLRRRIVRMLTLPFTNFMMGSPSFHFLLASVSSSMQWKCQCFLNYAIQMSNFLHHLGRGIKWDDAWKALSTVGR